MPILFTSPTRTKQDKTVFLLPLDKLLAVANNNDDDDDDDDDDDATVPLVPYCLRLH